MFGVDRLLFIVYCSGFRVQGFKPDREQVLLGRVRFGDAFDEGELDAIELAHKLSRRDVPEGYPAKANSAI